MSTAVITGSNRGLGFATAEALAAAGTRVLLTSRREADAKEAAATLTARGYEAHGIELDVTDADSVARAAEWVRQSFGTLDILVNNAGILPEATDAEEHEFASLPLFRESFDTNVFGAVAMIEALLPMLRTSAAGRIVNVSTTMGSLAEQLNPESPYYGMVLPAYQSSKAALNAVTIALSKKLADTTTKVTSVCPGFVQTDLTPINRDQAPLTATEAAAVVVRAATLPADAPSGSFFDQNGTVAW
ncbi:SDR family NAD(P)-dependent oxidoreductase [Nocardia neocaledoniensis]|uniref:SDR family NAD(P)-dependent oxidoreductase n=1 Tax=Nocardia neocaledoniensis TaxID=236511 RepID=UPI003406DEDF